MMISAEIVVCMWIAQANVSKREGKLKQVSVLDHRSQGARCALKLKENNEEGDTLAAALCIFIYMGFLFFLCSAKHQKGRDTSWKISIKDALPFMPCVRVCVSLNLHALFVCGHEGKIGDACTLSKKKCWSKKRRRHRVHSSFPLATCGQTQDMKEENNGTYIVSARIDCSVMRHGVT